MNREDHHTEDRIEGKNPVLEALKANRPIHKLWITKHDLKRLDPDRVRILKMAKLAGAAILELDGETMDRMAVTRSHQGIIAQFAAHEYVPLEQILEISSERSEDPMLLVLDNLQESYNLGAILRIADAAGVNGVVIPKHRSVGLDAAVAKSSAGAIEHIPVAKVGNLSQAVDYLKKEGFWIYGASHTAEKRYDQMDFKGKIAIVIGSEGEGMSLQIEKKCDYLIHIPMKGRINSLNAAVAAGVIVFEALRQRSLS
jgi:23S rRNA (guanosine2251-2'-O)-methyltransferase